MIKLYGFRSMWGLPDISAFVTKVDAYLRMTGVPYQLEPYPFFELDKTPKGKLPVIDDGDQRVADSSFIVEHLEETRGVSLDAHLSAQERAIALGFRRLLEENLYWVMIQIRWRIDDNWRAFMDQLFGDFPDQAMLANVLPQVREAVLQEMWGHGMKRHSIDEVWHIGKTDVTALADFLAAKPYFMGTEPSSLDAVAYAFLTSVAAGFDSPVKQHIEAQANLVGFFQRFEERYYAD